MLKASFFRSGLLALGVVLLSVSGSAQDRSWGVGTDGLLWATGWSHGQAALCLTDELRLQAGFGVLRGADSPMSALLRPRPGTFDRAGLVSCGVRANPGVVDGRPFRGLIGIEWSSETWSSPPWPMGHAGHHEMEPAGCPSVGRGRVVLRFRLGPELPRRSGAFRNARRRL